jgi:hypothetical protein
MIIISLRVFEKQFPVSRGDCFLSGCYAIAKYARNDMWLLQSASEAPLGEATLARSAGAASTESIVSP